MPKRHYAVPRQLPQRWTADGPIESITVYEAVCHHNGYQPHATTDEARVTCAHCLRYLGLQATWEAERQRPQLTTSQTERLMLDVICDRCEGFAGMRAALTRLICDHPSVYAALKGVLRNDIDTYWRNEQAAGAEEAAENESQGL